MDEYIERETAIAWFMPYAHAEESIDADVVISDIKGMKAADVAPVRHGEWIVCGDGDNVPWMCSHCGKTTANKYKVMYGKYCPNCGAKMDLEG